MYTMREVKAYEMKLELAMTHLSLSSFFRRRRRERDGVLENFGNLEGSMRDFTVCGECGTVTMACPDDGSALIDPRLMECEWGHVTEPVEYNAEGIYTQVA